MQALVKPLQKIALTLSLGLLFVVAHGQHRNTRSEYINQWKDAAVLHMHEYGIPASITLAQGILESADGNSTLARTANNHFGIKCHNWNGPGVYADDDKKNECFRKYKNAEASYRDHAEFLKGKQRYASLFELKPTDYKGWAKGLKKAGYATNPKYPSLLINLIEKHELYTYDRMKKPSKKGKDKKEPKKTEAPAEELTVTLSASRKVQLSKNGIKYILAKEEDNIKKIGKDLDIDRRLLFRYNDLTKKDELHENEVIYLQPKRNSSRTHKWHKVQKGESMRDISQKYGVKMSKLYKKNNLPVGTQPKAGDKLSLKKKLPAEN